MKYCEVCGTTSLLIASGSFSASLARSNASVSINNFQRDNSFASVTFSDQSHESPRLNDYENDAQNMVKDYDYIRLKKSEYDHLKYQDREYCGMLKERLMNQCQSAVSLALLAKELAHSDIFEENWHEHYCPTNNSSISIEPTELTLSRKKNELRCLQEQRKYLLQKKRKNDAKLCALKERKERIDEREKNVSKLFMSHKMKEVIHKDVFDLVTQRAQSMHMLRLQLVARMFRMMPIEVQSIGCSKKTKGSKRSAQLRGCSSIMSLPIPNNGQFENVPADIVGTVLGHISQLMDAVATVLNISLSHPVRPFTWNGLSAISPQFAEDSKAYCLCPLTMHNNRDSLRDFDWMSMEELSKFKKSKDPAHNFEPNGLVVDSTATVNPEFPKALMLLRADVVSLCLKVGLHPSKLWPSEAMLLNLKLLEEHIDLLISQFGGELATDLVNSLSAGSEETITFIKEKFCRRYVPLHLTTSTDPHEIDWIFQDQQNDEIDGTPDNESVVEDADVEESTNSNNGDDEWDLVDCKSI